MIPRQGLEEHVLGAVLLEPERFADVAYLGLDHFVDPAHRALWGVLQGLAANGGIVDLTHVLAACNGRVDLGLVRRLWDQTTTAATVTQYAEALLTAEVPRETTPAPAESPPADDLPPPEAYAVDEAIAAAREPWAASVPATEESAKAENAPHAPLCWPKLALGTPPPREWVMPEWIPAGHITLLSGRGGIGKTLLSQQLATAIAGGKAFITDLEPRKVLMWAGEDDERELWLRQANICSYLEVPMADLDGRFVLHSYCGTDITLASTQYGALIPTAGLEVLRKQVVAEQPDLVILDNVAALYGGNENVRHDVKTWCSWVQSACAPAAVLLLSHPAKAIGSEYSGSTAWEGSVRSRLYLGDKPPDEKADGDEDAPPTQDRYRYLCRRKANYSDEDMVVLSLIEGVFVPLRQPVERKAAAGSAMCRQIVETALRTLAARSIAASASTASRSYLPKVAKQYGLLGGLTERQFGATMRAMILDGVIATAKVGTYGNRHAQYGIALVDKQ